MRRQLLALTCVAVVLCARLAAAAPQGVPTRIPFGGSLPGVQGPVTLTFSLYAEQEGGTLLWSETQNVIVGADGSYAVALGSAAPEGLPSTVFAVNAPRWIGVQAAGGVELPRLAIISVPYAMKADDATTIGGKPLSAFVLAGDKTGVGPDGLSYVDTKVINQALSGGAAQAVASGSAGYIGVFTDSTNLGNSALFQTAGGRIGLNTAAAAAPFHIVSGEMPSSFIDVYSGSNVSILGTLPVVHRAARGTVASPSNVQNNDILGGLAVRGYGATGFSQGRGQVMFRAAENWTDTANGTFLQLTTTATGTNTFVERMRIAPNGYIGFATTNPVFPVDARSARGTTYARFGSDVATPVFLMAGNPAIGFNAYYEGGYKFAATGRAAAIGLDPSSGYLTIGLTGSSGSADASATMTSRMYFNPIGQVGIGTAPLHTLHVNGEVFANGPGTFEGNSAVVGAVTAIVFNATHKAMSAQVAGDEVMTVDAGGVHAGPGMTGTPLAFGLVYSNGVWASASHSSNVASVTRTGVGTYVVSITGATMSYAAHTTALTIMGDAGYGFIAYVYSGGNMYVYTTAINGAAADRSFSFVIMKM